MRKKIICSYILLLCGLVSLAQSSKIVSGPVLGQVELRTATILLEVDPSVKSVVLQYWKKNEYNTVAKTVTYKGQLGNDFNPIKMDIGDERDEILETGGGLLKAKSLLKSNEPFLTINVDILTNLNIKNLLFYHTQHSPLITLAVTNRTTSRYFLFDDNNRLCGWRNIKTGEEKIIVPKTNFIQKAYSGIAVFSPTIFPFIKQQGKFSLTETYLDLCKNHSIIGFDHSGDNIIDVGKPASVPIAASIFN